MLPVIAVAPVTEPLSLEEAKLHLRVSSSSEDTLITDLIKAARERCEEICARSFVTRTYDYYVDAWPHCDSILLPMPPVQSITSITYHDHEGDTHVVGSGDYYLAPAGGRLVLVANASWPTEALRNREGIVIRYVAGYTTVPSWAKHAMRLLIGHWYINREEVTVGIVGHRMPDAALTILRANRAY